MIIRKPYCKAIGCTRKCVDLFTSLISLHVIYHDAEERSYCPDRCIVLGCLNASAWTECLPGQAECIGRTFHGHIIQARLQELLQTMLGDQYQGVRVLLPQTIDRTTSWSSVEAPPKVDSQMVLGLYHVVRLGSEQTNLGHCKIDINWADDRRRM